MMVAEQERAREATHLADVDRDNFTHCCLVLVESSVSAEDERNALDSGTLWRETLAVALYWSGRGRPTTHNPAPTLIHVMLG